jgi:hypothetical protein
MQSLAKSRRASQLPLFHPPIATPHWESLPQEVRRQTLALLVRLLRASAHDTNEVSEEARDE